jgi:hypothetical protein
VMAGIIGQDDILQLTKSSYALVLKRKFSRKSRDRGKANNKVRYLKRGSWRASNFFLVRKSKIRKFLGSFHKFLRCASPQICND